MTYNEFIESCRTKSVDRKHGHYHHIIPLCVGGSNDASNLILLSWEDHWLAHKILAEENPTNENLVWAYQHNSTLENFLRRAATRNDPSVKAKISATLMGHPVSEESKKKISEKSKAQHRHISDSHKQAISNACKGRVSPTKGTKWKLIDGKRYYYREEV